MKKGNFIEEMRTESENKMVNIRNMRKNEQIEVLKVQIFYLLKRFEGELRSKAKSSKDVELLCGIREIRGEEDRKVWVDLEEILGEEGSG